jgi:hypothetical protein
MQRPAFYNLRTSEPVWNSVGSFFALTGAFNVIRLFRSAGNLLDEMKRQLEAYQRQHGRLDDYVSDRLSVESACLVAFSVIYLLLFAIYAVLFLGETLDHLALFAESARDRFFFATTILDLLLGLIPVRRLLYITERSMENYLNGKTAGSCPVEVDNKPTFWVCRGQQIYVSELLVALVNILILNIAGCIIFSAWLHSSCLIFRLL